MRLAQEEYKRVSKKKIFNMIFALIVFSILFALLFPRSFLRSIDNEIKSISLVIIKNSLEHEQTEYTFNDGVYRMGYWGNKTHLNFMGEICQALTSD